MSTETGNGPTPEPEVVRQQHFPLTGPAELDVQVGAGLVEVRLDAGAEDGVHVSVRHAPEAAGPFATGISGLVTWVTSQFGGGGGQQEDAAGEAVRQTRVEQVGQRLVVRAPTSLPLKMVPLAVTVHAPAGSRVTVNSKAADVTITGNANRLDVNTGTGDVSVDRVEDRTSVYTDTGDIRLGAVLGNLRARTGTGDLAVSTVGASATLNTASGDVWVGEVTADLSVRTGTGDLKVADIAAGRIELQTGSGEIRVGIREGIPAEVDVSSGAGEAQSQLDVQDTPPAGETVPVRLRAHTGAGNALVTGAAA
ncbi:hypothetical protein GCM10012275_06550 [Longimycelium tulufanense]|uniref:DUF4097 domain-containing protein n=1 Tax=Longimycelium tulufanense TaxID=907463 RepID=A0A8J3CA98_9PSEU|nr:DUF4097 family beta strand repeat-containing protein [Longimycelium tulufanense]GGM38226.1 hypothetical protein GCM10012275_06550 [Longimycelium tulufanense]